MVKVITVDGTLLFLVASTYYLLISSILSIGSTPLFLNAGGGPSSIVLVCFLSFIAGGNLLSAISSLFCLLLLMVVFYLLFSIIFCFLLLIVVFHLPFLVIILFFIADDNLLFTISIGSSLSLIPSANLLALFLPNILFYICYFSLSFLPLFYSFLPSLFMPFAHNPALFTRKRLFNQAFIGQMPITLIL